MNTAFASYVIVAWVVLAVAVFPSFPPQRGVLVILLSGTLFLPVLDSGMVELGPVKFSKTNAVCYALLLACLLFDAKRLFALTPSWADLPVLVWCVFPALSVLHNDPPPDGSPALRDAVAQSLVQTTRYLIPYLIGRVYFSDPDGMRALAAGIVAAALVYVPFCLFEVKQSPQLHVIVYGYMPHEFAQQVRFGGYRPMVFLGHGLAVAFFMGTAMILAAWTRNTDPAAGGWHNWAVWVLGAALLLCKSVGPTVLVCVGLVPRSLARSAALRVALLGLVAIPPAYCLVRSTGYWGGTNLVEFAEDTISEDRAESLQFRFEQENELIARALERPAFGWGGWGRSRVRDENDKDVSVTDGLWIIIMGNYGIVGLMVYGAMTLLPVARYAWLLPPAAGASRPYAASNGCAVVIGLWCIDSLLNAMAIPLFIVMVGGLTRLRFADETSGKGVGQRDAQQERSECNL
jgi:hypothetical protein